MKFKEPHMEMEFLQAPFLLKHIALKFDEISNQFGIDPVVTRILDPVEGESGVHLDYRAIDFRDVYQGKSLYTEDQKLSLLYTINAMFPRKDAFRTMKHHKGTSYHFHLQLPALIKNI